MLPSPRMGSSGKQTFRSKGNNLNGKCHVFTAVSTEREERREREIEIERERERERMRAFVPNHIIHIFS